MPVPGDPHDLASLELSATEMRAMARTVVDRLVDHITSLSDLPASGLVEDGADYGRAMREPPPEQGAELEALLAPLLDDWALRSFNCAGPGYLAYVPGGGIFPAALADLIADGINRYTGVWNAAPALVQLEANVLDWLRDWMAFPATTRGLLTTGGSMATFTAIVTARHKLLGPAWRDGVLYTSTQAHHCVAKAAQLAGILPDRVRVIDVDECERLRVDRLAEAIEVDRRAGLRPFMVVSAAGTTNTGAIDPLDAIADLCAAEQLWHHCDGAYGGFFHMCPELRPLLAGLPRADSLTLDPHKGLFLPFGTGALLVRDGEALRAAHAGHAGYLPPLPPSDIYNPAQFGPELSRPFRGLRLWLPLKLFGAERFRAALAEKRALALQCAERLTAVEGLQLLAPPPLSLFAYQFGWDGATGEQRNAATRALLEGVNRRNRVLLTGAPVGEHFYGRVCVLCFRTRQANIDACVEDLGAEAAAILKARR